MERIDCNNALPEALKYVSSSLVRGSFQKAQEFIPFEALKYIIQENLYEWKDQEDKARVEAFRARHHLKLPSGRQD